MTVPALPADWDDARRSEYAKVEAYALRFLSYRPRSSWELETRLKSRDTPGEFIDLIVRRCVAWGYLDDWAFAEWWLENRLNSKPVGPRRLASELRQKGIDRQLIDRAVTRLKQEDLVKLAVRLASSRLTRHRTETAETVERKLAGFLERRGFSYSTIKAAVTAAMASRNAASCQCKNDPHS